MVLLTILFISLIFFPFGSTKANLCISLFFLIFKKNKLIKTNYRKYLIIKNIQLKENENFLLNVDLVSEKYRFKGITKINPKTSERHLIT